MGLEPDATAFSTAITAISRSEPVCYGQALGLFRRMRRRGVERDAVAYNAMFHACAQARRTGHAIRLRTLMRLERVRPTSISYSVMLQLLWHRSDEAASILDEAMSLPGSFQQCLQVVRAPSQTVPTRSTGSSQSGALWTLDLHKFSPGAAVALVLWVVSKIIKLEVSGQPLPVNFAIITGWGKHNDNGPDIGRERGAVRRAVLEAVRICSLPMVRSGDAPSAVEERLPSTKANPGLVELDMGRFSQWTDAAIRSGLIRGYFAHGDRLLVDVSRFAQSILSITNSSAQQT
jgi:pentatricopeptide repeat protein